jgi:hypothetical protein
MKAAIDVQQDGKPFTGITSMKCLQLCKTQLEEMHPTQEAQEKIWDEVRAKVSYHRNST